MPELPRPPPPKKFSTRERATVRIGTMPPAPGLPQSATQFLARHQERLRRMPTRKRIVFPEGDDPRVQAAAARLIAERLVDPILLTRDSAPPATYAALFL